MKPTDYFEHFSTLMRKRFPSEGKLSYFLGEMRLAYGWTIANCEVKEICKADGCAIVYRAPSLPNDRVQFGFMIIPADPHMAQELWSEVQSCAQEMQASSLAGPINGTTYFPYRFVFETDDSPFFKGEYFSTTHDHAFMMKQAPAKVLFYRSGMRDHFQGVIDVSRPYYEKAMEMGLEIHPHDHVDEPLFKEVIALIGKIFGDNWSFTELSEAELRMIYAQEFEHSTPLMLHTFHHEGKMIGFCRYVENDEGTLICKTLGLLPSYRKMGLGNATVVSMHEDAIDAGYSKMIYALIYDGNRVQQNMPKDDSVIFRRYASYEFDLG